MRRNPTDRTAPPLPGGEGEEPAPVPGGGGAPPAASPFGAEYFERAYGKEYDRRNPPRKLDWLLARIREAKPSGRLLDVGCAYGLFLSRARRFFDVAGCDVSAHAVEVVRRRFPGLDVSRAGVEELSCGAPFDVVTCFDVLEHVPDLEGALARLRRCLRGDGLLVLTVPVYDGLPGRLVRFLDRDETHIWKRGRNFWRELLARNGFAIVDEAGLWRYPLPGAGYLFLGSARLRNFSPALLLIGSPA